MKEDFAKEGLQRIEEKDLEVVVKKEEQVRNSLSRIEKNVKDELETLLELLKDYYRGEYKAISWRSVALAVFAFLYLINPLDLLPDFSGAIGFVDDLAVMGSVVASLADDIKHYKKWREEKEKNQRT
ncbi:MAG: DUF1232 domain-containing protein [candidate division WOR-3 bacterium]